MMDDAYTPTSPMGKKKENAGFGIAAVLYVLVFLTCVRTWHDHSWVLLLSLYVELAGLMNVVVNVWLSKSMAGMSQTFIVAYGVATSARFFADYQHPAYLPGDEPSEHATYRWMEGFYTILLVWLAISSLTVYRETVDKDLMEKPEYSIAAAVLAGFAVFLRPYVLRPMILDIVWTFGLYLESVAVVPQLLLFRQKNCRKFMVNFFIAVVVGKAFQFIFWFWYFGMDLGRSFLLIHVGCYGINLLLMSRFIQRYLKEINSCPLPIFSMK